MNPLAKKYEIDKALEALGIKNDNHGTSFDQEFFGHGEMISSHSPVDGELIGKVSQTTAEDYQKVIQEAEKGFKAWRQWTAPQRGEVVRKFNEELRRLKAPLGKLVSYEMGKSYQEGLGRSARND